jgi:hypothetical protein
MGTDVVYGTIMAINMGTVGTEIVTEAQFQHTRC